MLARLIPLTKLDDARLAARAGGGDPVAFAALYDRHHASLLAFCRHMLANRQDGEDALQQTFIRAHRALLRGHRPDEPRAWLFTIARNRCRTMLGARRDTLADGNEQLERVCVDGLPAELQQRADLRELLADITKLPEDQRAALLLSELRGFSQEQIALVIGCPAQKVKALVFQARTHLLAEREARDTECVAIRQQLEVARGGELRRGLLRRHLRRCEPCKTYSIAVAAQRNELAGILAVLPSATLKLSVLGAVGIVGDSAAGGAAAAGLAGSSAMTGGAAGSAAGGLSVGAATGIATKLAVVKVAAVLAVSGGAAAGATAVVTRDGHEADRTSVTHSQRAATRDSSGSEPSARGLISAATNRPATTGNRLTRERRATRARRSASRRLSSRRARARSRRRVGRRRAAELRTARRRAGIRRQAIKSAGRTRSQRRAAAKRRAGGAASDRPARPRVVINEADPREGPGVPGRRTGTPRPHRPANPRPQDPRPRTPAPPAPEPPAKPRPQGSHRPGAGASTPEQPNPQAHGPQRPGPGARPTPRPAVAPPAPSATGESPTQPLGPMP